MQAQGKVDDLQKQSPARDEVEVDPPIVVVRVVPHVGHEDREHGQEEEKRGGCGGGGYLFGASGSPGGG